MKTKEFIKRVKELGYNCFTNGSYIFINKGYPWIATIALHRMYYMELWTNDNKLGELCMEYARTPIDEREEEKKYYLKLKRENREFYESLSAYLTLHKRENTFSLDVGVETAGLKCKFTQEEIDEIKEEQHTDLSEFEQIPVEEIEE